MTQEEIDEIFEKTEARLLRFSSALQIILKEFSEGRLEYVACKRYLDMLASNDSELENLAITTIMGKYEKEYNEIISKRGEEEKFAPYRKLWG